MNTLYPYKKKKKINPVFSIFAVLAWLALWQAAASVVDKAVFLPKPSSVFQYFFHLLLDSGFWKCTAFSVFHILCGFSGAVVCGIIFALLAYFFPVLQAFFSFPLKVIRAVPVASFIILALLWVSSLRLSLLISFMMALPILYFETLSGFFSVDEKLLEMAYIYKLSPQRKIRFLLIPGASSHITAALCTAAGLAWKAGIAAEVIGITRHSIGNQLYQAKIYLQTTELFAWTIAIIIISFLFEYLLLFIIRKFGRKDGHT